MKIPLFSGGQEVLNATLNKAINVFNAFFSTTLNGGYDPDAPDEKYSIDETIIPSYTDDERLALSNPQEGELIINSTYNQINVFMNGKWQKVESELYDSLYTVTVRDNATTDPIESASVTIDGNTILTNASGVAVVPVVPFSGTVSISVSKSGYTTYSSTISPTPTSFTVNLS